MTDPFAALVYPVIRHVVDFQNHLESGGHVPLGVMREQLLNFLDQADQKAGGSSQLAHDWEVAKFAIIYWIDETLINSPWNSADEWRQHILEWDLYRERLRADRFFEKAAEAASYAGTDPLEVYFLCVALGFRGKYVDNPAPLKAWSERVYGRIVAGGKQPDRFLPDEPRDPDRPPLQPLPGTRILLEMSLLVSITALATLACFVIAARGGAY